jgi:hypothetical protein
VKRVQRWRYYCDHCKKVSGLRSAMEKHEKGCTLNPARDCGICGFLGGGMAVTTQELVALLPDPAAFVRTVPEQRYFDGIEWDTIAAYQEPDDAALREATQAVLPRLRELTENCPACILAALRQRGIPVPLIEDFNWTTEFKAAQERMNEHREEQEGGHY